MLFAPGQQGLRPQLLRHQQGTRGGVLRVASRANVQTRPLSVHPTTTAPTANQQQPKWSVREFTDGEEEEDVKEADTLGSGPMKVRSAAGTSRATPTEASTRPLHGGPCT